MNYNMRKILFALCFVSAAGCHSQTVTGLENIGIDCAKGQISSLTNALLPSVADLLTGKSPTWGSDLDSLVSAIGSAAVCAVDNVVSKAQSQRQGANGAVMAKPPTAVEVNGRDYLAKHKLKVVHK